MPKGTPRHPIVRAIDERIQLAQREVRRLEAARTELQRPSAMDRAAARARKPPAARVTRPTRV